MAIIVAGRFDHIQPAESAIGALQRVAVPPHSISKFHLNPSGAHGVLPGGGDVHADAGSETASGGSIAGAAVGAAALATAAAVVAPPLAAVAAAAVGAYTGSLVGALSQMKDKTEATPEADAPARKAGIIVAVNASDSGLSTEQIATVLKQHGSDTVELAEGNWKAGEGWDDFDPTSTPHLI